MRKEEIDIPAILNLTGDLFIVTDSSGKILFHSTCHSEVSLLARKPLRVGTMVSEIVKAGREEIVSEIIAEVVKTRKPYKTEVEYTGSENNPLHLQVTYAPVYDRDNNQPRVYILVRDITPQRIFERKLSSLAKNISKLIEESNAIVIGLDTRGYITDWNEYTVRITGFSKNDVYAQKFAEVVLPEDERKLFDRLLAEILSVGQVRNYEITMCTSTNKHIIALLSGTPRTSTSGAIIGVALVGQDVTELMEYRRLLEVKVEERTRELMVALRKEREIVEMKNRFVSIASHEFRTPLVSIHSSLQSIKTTLHSHELKLISPGIEEIENQVKHLNLLLDDVLTYGRSEAGKIQLVFSPIVPARFFHNLKLDVEKSFDSIKKIETNFINLNGEIISDEKLLRSIFTNLLSNAIKFSPGKDLVRFEAECLGNYLVASVTDSGIGIPKNELVKIFEPFLRGAGASAIEGTGLGLSIVKKAVELLQGTITVESQVNVGSKFTVKIPIKYD